MDWCTGRCDVTEILLKMVLNTKLSINQLTTNRILTCNDPLAYRKLSVCRKSQPLLQVFTTQSGPLTTLSLRKRPFENIAGKGENAGHQHFLLFPQCFLLFQKSSSIFESHLFCRLQSLSIWTGQKFCRLVKS